MLLSSRDKYAGKHQTQGQQGQQTGQYEDEPTEFTDSSPTRQFLAREKVISKKVGMSFFQNSMSRHSMPPQMPETASTSGTLSRTHHGSVQHSSQPHDVETSSDASHSPRVSPGSADVGDSYLFGHGHTDKSIQRNSIYSSNENKGGASDSLTDSADLMPVAGVVGMEDHPSNEAGQESLLQILSDYPDGFTVLLREAKKTITSTKEAITVFKKRAEAEEQYSKSMHRISQLTLKTEGKSGSFGNAWQQYGKIHEKIGLSRGKYAEALSHLAEEMLLIQKDTERSRKNLKEGHARRWKEMQDADGALEKTRIKYESTNDDWEKAVFAENSGVPNLQSQRRFGITKNVSNSIMMFKVGLEKNFKRTEEDSCAKAAIAKENYRMHIQTTNAVRKEFYRTLLPQFVTNLKQTVDEADDRLCQFMVRYGKLTLDQQIYEDDILNPNESSEGIRHLVDSIDTRRDHEVIIKELAKSNPIDKSDREYIPIKSSLGHSGSTSSNEMTLTTSPLSLTPHSSQHSPSTRGDKSLAGHCFGIPLTQLTQNDTSADPVPTVVLRCIEYIEMCGMSTPGLYRVSGSSGQVQKLKQSLDKDPASVRFEQIVEDIHALTGALKLFFRELPEPLLPRHIYHQLIDAAKIGDDRMRLIQIHELVNTLEDAHYATLKCLAGHLWRVQSDSSVNKMSIGNLGIVWGPTLMDSPDSGADASDLKYQSKAIETIVANFDHIFDTDISNSEITTQIAGSQHSIPGVENVYTWLRGGVLNGEADLDQRWLDGTVEHESMGTRHDNRALAARLADFLQVAYRQYQSTLWQYHRDRIVEVS
ncbi:hypothetical protein BASA50_002824 [Batrachochytrium salamandrivorans]|uniref:Rho-GAP domain-containing protein n=1 Tax=Batrachochytrium salamandrivorans TaxID=1357716 RepID=A0ABQ8FN46_9FUNG|nr:hypothetical protein BASA50_002824 [Batrachochytrium salamandrivorans]